MKSGKERTLVFKSTINLSDYDDAHRDSKCKGKWEPLGRDNVPFSIDALGMVMVPFAPFIVCNKCKSAYVFPGFLEFVDRIIAEVLVKGSHPLLPKQIRFLRIAFDKTQEDIAKFLGVQRTYYSKTESEKTGINLGLAQQVRLKLYYAEILEIKDSTVIYGMNKIDENAEPPKVLQLPQEPFKNIEPKRLLSGH